MADQALKLVYALHQTVVCVRAIQLLEKTTDFASDVVDLADGIAGARILLDQTSLLTREPG